MWAHVLLAPKKAETKTKNKPQNLCAQTLGHLASQPIWQKQGEPTSHFLEDRRPREVENFSQSLIMDWTLSQTITGLFLDPTLAPAEQIRQSETSGWPRPSFLSWNACRKQQGHKHKQLFQQDAEPDSWSIYRRAPLLLSFARIYQVHLGLRGWQPVYHPRCPSWRLGHPPRMRFGGLPMLHLTWPPNTGPGQPSLPKFHLLPNSPCTVSTTTTHTPSELTVSG